MGARRSAADDFDDLFTVSRRERRAIRRSNRRVWDEDDDDFDFDDDDEGFDALEPGKRR